MKRVYATVALILLAALAYNAPATAHVVDGELKIVGNYRVQFRVSPSPPEIGEAATLFFSIQDLELRDLENVTVKISLLRGGDTLKVIGDEFQRFGDFQYQVTFPEAGRYTVLLSFTTSDGSSNDVEFEVVVGGEDGFPTEVVVALLIVAVAALLVFLRRARRS